MEKGKSFNVYDNALLPGVPFVFKLGPVYDNDDNSGVKAYGVMQSNMPGIQTWRKSEGKKSGGVVEGDGVIFKTEQSNLVDFIRLCPRGDTLVITKTDDKNFEIRSGIPDEGLGDMVESVQVDETKVEEIVKERVEEKTTQSSREDVTQRSITMSYVATIAASRAQMTDQDMVECAEYLNCWIVNGKEGNKGGVPF